MITFQQIDAGEYQALEVRKDGERFGSITENGHLILEMDSKTIINLDKKELEAILIQVQNRSR